MSKTAITREQIIAEDLASSIVELRRLGMHLQDADKELAARLFTFAEMYQATLPLVESLEKKGRAML